MKASRVFIVVIIAIMAMVILFEINAPSRYRWEDTSHSYKSKQPFGCYVMDSVLRASLPQGYEVVGEDVEQYFDNESKGVKHTFLIIGDGYDFINLHDEDLLKMIEEGNNMVWVTDQILFNGYISEQLGGIIMTSLSDIYIDSYTVKERLSDPTMRDTVNWLGDGTFAPATYTLNSILCPSELNLSSPFNTLATLRTERYRSYDSEGVNHTFVVAAIRNYGEGKVVMVSMPLLFTNYGILNDTIRPLALRLLSVCGNLPVVRYDRTFISQSADEKDNESPLRYLLANRPLRWAFYLALATIVAFVFFTARRRQRVIPVIKPPVNHMMDFVKRIGGIYYKRHDNVDLLIKKYVTFSNDLRSQAMIDIDNYEHIDEELQMLSNRTGIPFDELQRQIHDVWNATNATSIKDERLQQLIDMMNNILHKINI